MAATRRRLPPAKEQFLRPQRLSAEEEQRLRRMGTSERALALGKLSRGTIAGPKRFGKSSPLQARIRFLENGAVEKISMAAVGPGRFSQYRKENYEDIETAFRKTGHVIESLRMELKREKEAQKRINEVHASIYGNRAGMGAGERQESMRAILDIVDLLQKRYPRSEKLGLEEKEEIMRHPLERTEKEAAVKRLNRAIGLFKAGNPGAAFALLAGASNSLIAQQTILMDQISSTMRDRKILAGEINRRQGTAGAYEGKICPKEKLPLIRNWAPNARLRFAAGQIGLFAEKLGAWLAKARLGQKKNMRAWLGVMENSLKGAIPGTIMQELRLAGGMLESSPPEAKAHLLNVAEALAGQAGRTQ